DLKHDFRRIAGQTCRLPLPIRRRMNKPEVLQELNIPVYMLEIPLRESRQLRHRIWLVLPDESKQRKTVFCQKATNRFETFEILSLSWLDLLPLLDRLHGRDGLVQRLTYRFQSNANRL